MVTRTGILILCFKILKLRTFHSFLQDRAFLVLVVKLELECNFELFQYDLMSYIIKNVTQL